MFANQKVLFDALIGTSLGVVLLIVFVGDRLGRSAPQEEVSPNTLEVRIVDDASMRSAGGKRLRLAVTPTHYEINPFNGTSLPWDDMGKLLKKLGEGYRYDEVKPPDLLNNPRMLDPYDVLFLTCAPKGQELRDLLVQFVSRGGTLYAADWRYDAVASAFPDLLDATSRAEGTKQEIVADVVDPSLREVLGRQTIPLRFDLPRWKTAAFRGPRVTTLIQGRYQKQQYLQDLVGVPATAPLLVKMAIGKGTVIFTSFHAEQQNEELEKKLLQYLVFSLVTAEVDAQVAALDQKEGFVPQKGNLLGIPKENPTITRTYQNQKKGPLRFALGFRNEGAELRLVLRSPDGRTFTWEGKSTVVLEVPQAAVGEWTYTVTALQLPYENFPFTVRVSEKNKS